MRQRVTIEASGGDTAKKMLQHVEAEIADWGEAMLIEAVIRWDHNSGRYEIEATFERT